MSACDMESPVVIILTVHSIYRCGVNTEYLKWFQSNRNRYPLGAGSDEAT